MPRSNEVKKSWIIGGSKTNISGRKIHVARSAKGLNEDRVLKSQREESRG